MLSLAEEVRAKYMGDIHQFMSGGWSEHGSAEINGELVERLRAHGVKARLARLGRHWVVVAEVEGREIVADAVPELSGLFNEVLPGPFVGTREEAKELYRA